MRKLAYLCAQFLHTRGKRGKDASFRLVPFIEAMIASTALAHTAPILIIGPRNKIELNLWRQYGYYNVIGLDLFPASAGILKGDMHQLPFPDTHFALVAGIHVFEHAFDSKLALAEAVRVLIPGGYLFAAFPVLFTPSIHDRVDYGDEAGFLAHLPADTRWQRLWGRTAPTECAVLLRLERK